MSQDFGSVERGWENAWEYRRDREHEDAWRRDEEKRAQEVEDALFSLVEDRDDGLDSDAEAQAWARRGLRAAKRREWYLALGFFDIATEEDGWFLQAVKAIEDGEVL